MARRNKPSGLIRFDLKRTSLEKLCAIAIEREKSLFRIPHYYPDTKILAPKKVEVYYGYQSGNKVIIFTTEQGNDLSQVYASEVEVARQEKTVDLFDCPYTSSGMSEYLLKRLHSDKKGIFSDLMKPLVFTGNTHPFRGL